LQNKVRDHDLPFGGVLISESDDLLVAEGPAGGPLTFMGDVELRTFCCGGEAGVNDSSGSGEL
jgi:hypothetical protein